MYYEIKTNENNSYYISNKNLFEKKNTLKNRKHVQKNNVSAT